MRTIDSQDLEKSIIIKDDLSQLSISLSLREAFAKTYSFEFMKFVAPAYLIIVLISMIQFEAGQFCNLLATIAVVTGWLNHLNFSESLFLSFKKRELRFGAWMVMIGMLLVMGAVIVAIIFTLLGSSPTILSILSMIWVAMILWLYPYFQIILSLVGLGYGGREVIFYAKQIVLPVHAQLFKGYLLIMALRTIMTLFFVMSFTSMGGGNFDVSLVVRLPFVLIMTGLHYFGEGVTAAFSSHILYCRAVMKRI